jgi:uncharacterized membrane protein (UPF0182 family)
MPDQKSSSEPSSSRRSPYRWIVLLIGGLVVADGVTFFMAEHLWFAELGFESVFWTRRSIQGAVGLLVSGVSLVVLWANLAAAHRLVRRTSGNHQSPVFGQMGMAPLLVLTGCLSLLIGAIALYYSQVAIAHWRPNLTLFGSVNPVPMKFRLQTFSLLGQQVIAAPVWGLGVLGLAGMVLVLPQITLWAIALLVSIGCGLVLSEQWARFLQAIFAVPFEQRDPLFGMDIGFFIFRLPFWELIIFWLLGLAALAWASVALVYLVGQSNLSDGKFPGFSGTQLRHLYGLSAVLLATGALSFWLDRYALAYSTLGANFGAGYTDVTVRLNAYTLLSVLALLLAALLAARALFWRHTGRVERETVPARRGDLLPLRPPARSRRIDRFPQRMVVVLLAYGGLVTLATLVAPFLVQAFVVQPNELELETPFLQRSIAQTRTAFDLDKLQVDTFNPQANLTLEDLRRNEQTLSSIRLWATQPLLDTNRQLQRIRPYYEFPGADIDRYLLPDASDNLVSRQVLIAARELDYDSVPAEAQTWINKHLIYTHGYGFTLSPVNVAAEGGLPDYFVQGIEQSISDPRLKGVIPTENPRIYYGEVTDNHVMTQTRVQELDFPSGSENVYNTYDGRGGIAIGAYWRRLLFAKHLRDWRMLFSEDLTPQTRLLFRRRIDSRVRAIAPFLRYDSDPYLVVADTRDGSSTATPSYLYWIMDAYTTSDRYPYSDPGGNDFNYIRNSVKVVVDAYNGSVAFYIADPEDPIIQTWSRIFPGMFRPLDQMPVALKSHLRYPQDFYQVQVNQLMVYHMTDSRVFYNREDQWRSPNEIYGSQTQVVRPYYLIMKLPTGTSEEFILFNPFTPEQRTNLIAWMAALSDGDDYGKVLLYRFPKQELVFGPEQLEARINQDPVISQQISLWNRQGSRAIQGNLLVIPIENALLYVEPLYLEAEQNRLPTLARVIVVYQNRIVMAETLQQGLEAIFRPDGSETPIIRPLEEPTSDAPPR